VHCIIDTDWKVQHAGNQSESSFQNDKSKVAIRQVQHPNKTYLSRTGFTDNYIKVAAFASSMYNYHFLTQ